MTENEKLLKKLFAEKDFKPNDAQYRAITHIEGPLFLTAGPGSGKTRVLLWRTLNLIVFHNVQPNEIFLATFTEKAALQLKEGLQGLLSIASKYTHKPYDIAEMYVGTLHSLCQKLLMLIIRLTLGLECLVKKVRRLILLRTVFHSLTE